MDSFTDKYKKQIDWLLVSDASIRYQSYRDLIKADNKTIEDEKKKINTSGWGKQFLDLQDEAGTWSKGLYTPKWTSTFYTLQNLKILGTEGNDNIRKACLLLLDKGFYADNGLNLSRTLKYSDTCVAGMFLSIILHFGIKDWRIDKLIEFLISHQMSDGGWNCEINKGARHSSFHTTISVLEGLREYEKSGNITHFQTVKELQNKGIEFLLQHKLFRSHQTGAVVDLKMIRFSFPSYWKYDIMRALDYFQEMKAFRDDRLKDAISILESKQTKDGFWKLQEKHAGKVFFDMEQVGEPSRWNTLRALRILKWWYS